MVSGNEAVEAVPRCLSWRSAPNHNGRSHEVHPDEVYTSRTSAGKLNAIMTGAFVAWNHGWLKRSITECEIFYYTKSSHRIHLKQQFRALWKETVRFHSQVRWKLKMNKTGNWSLRHPPDQVTIQVPPSFSMDPQMSKKASACRIQRRCLNMRGEMMPWISKASLIHDSRITQFPSLPRLCV